MQKTSLTSPPNFKKINKLSRPVPDVGCGLCVHTLQKLVTRWASTTCAVVPFLAHCVITRSTAGPNSFFHRPDRRFESVVARTRRQIIVLHADEKESRVDIDDVIHRFHMFLQTSQHVLRVCPLPLRGLSPQQR